MPLLMTPGTMSGMKILDQGRCFTGILCCHAFHLTASGVNGMKGEWAHCLLNRVRLILVGSHSMSAMDPFVQKSELIAHALVFSVHPTSFGFPDIGSKSLSPELGCHFSCQSEVCSFLCLCITLVSTLNCKIIHFLWFKCHNFCRFEWSPSWEEHQRQFVHLMQTAF